MTKWTKFDAPQEKEQKLSCIFKQRRIGGKKTFQHT